MPLLRAFAFSGLLVVTAAAAWGNTVNCASSANLIQNCSFNEGLNASYPSADVPQDWDELGAWDNYDSLTQAYSLEAGGYSVKNGDAPPSLTGVGQTIVDVVGQTYLLTFWVYQDADNTTGPGQAYGAEWDGTIVGSETDQPASTSWTEYSYIVVGTGSDYLELGGYSYYGYNYLDDVSLTATTTPEGSPLVLCLTGLAAIGVCLALRRRTTATA